MILQEEMNNTKVIEEYVEDEKNSHHESRGFGLDQFNQLNFNQQLNEQGYSAKMIGVKSVGSNIYN